MGTQPGVVLKTRPSDCFCMHCVKYAGSPQGALFSLVPAKSAVTGAHKFLPLHVALARVQSHFPTAHPTNLPSPDLTYSRATTPWGRMLVNSCRLAKRRAPYQVPKKGTATLWTAPHAESCTCACLGLQLKCLPCVSCHFSAVERQQSQRQASSHAVGGQSNWPRRGGRRWAHSERTGGSVHPNALGCIPAAPAFQ